MLNKIEERIGISDKSQIAIRIRDLNTIIRQRNELIDALAYMLKYEGEYVERGGYAITKAKKALRVV